MEPPPPDQVTRCLREIQDGDSTAIDRLLPHVYADLKKLAERAFQGQWGPHTLQPTALVHEAYMRLVRPDGSAWENRRHFLRVAAVAMRQLLTDYARGKGREKRKGTGERVELEDGSEPATEEGIDLVALDDALSELRRLDDRQAEIVELRFLAGLTVEETAETLGVSVRTVFTDWSMARAWLERRLADS